MVTPRYFSQMGYLTMFQPNIRVTLRYLTAKYQVYSTIFQQIIRVILRYFSQISGLSYDISAKYHGHLTIIQPNTMVIRRYFSQIPGLSYDISAGHTECVDELLEHGAEVDVEDIKEPKHIY